MKKLVVLSIALLALTGCSSDDNSMVAPIGTISEGTIFGDAANPLAVGGPNQPNQVYVDLSTQKAAPAPRESWDIGFYSGSSFRVVLNGSLAMAAKQLETTDITVVQQADANVSVGTFQQANMAYIDDPKGDINATAFGNIATSKEEAKVFLINLGFSVPADTPQPGSVNTAGPARGWKKVKIWQEGAGYKMQYADIESVTPTEVSITKDAAYNHVFFSFTTDTAVQAEPQKDKWDMNFTTFTGEVFNNDGTSAGSYFLSDYIVINTKAGVTAFKAEGDAAAYEAFDLDALTAGNYQFTTDQRTIGDTWRSVFDRIAYQNVFYVVKDTEGNIYKIKLISMLGSNGHRGFPLFQYALVK